MAKHLVTLTTTGRRSGEPREARIYAFDTGDDDDGAGDIVVVGSHGGSAKDPAWAGNLRAEPRATVRVAKMARPVRAREADGVEYERLWLVVTAAFKMYASYQRKTKRRIPLFVLEAAASG